MRKLSFCFLYTDLSFCFLYTDHCDLCLAQSEERSDALLTCTKSFELHDDVAVLQRLDLSTVGSEEDFRAKLGDDGELANLLLTRHPGLVRNRTHQARVE